MNSNERQSVIRFGIQLGNLRLGSLKMLETQRQIDQLFELILITKISTQPIKSVTRSVGYATRCVFLCKWVGQAYCIMQDPQHRCWPGVKTLSMKLTQSQELQHFVSSIECLHDEWEILSSCEHQHDAILELHNFLTSSKSHDDVLRARFFERMNDLNRLMPKIKIMLPSLDFDHGVFVHAGFLADQVINPPLKYSAAQIVISEGTDACNFSIDLPIE